MAKMPVEAAAPVVEEEPVALMDGAVAAGGEEAAPEEPDHEVILTVCREADGSYRLIQGDEEDADATGEAEDDAVGAIPADEGAGKTYDSVGALMKAILDVLNEGESSEGEEGSSEDQFQMGFGGAPAAGGGTKPASPLV